MKRIAFLILVMGIFLHLDMYAQGGTTGDGIISGTITDLDSGSPVLKAAIQAVSLDRSFRANVSSGSNGKYSVSVPAGKYIVHFMAQGYAGQFYNNRTGVLSAEVLTVNTGETLNDINAALKALLPPAQFTLSGNVKDSAGNPVTARIIILAENHRLSTRMVYAAVTDTKGDYSLKLREGDSVVVFVHPGEGKIEALFYNNKKEFAEADVILITKDTSGIDFTLKASPVYDNSISGKVKDQSGKGVLASITAFNLDHKQAALFKKSTISDSLGNYRFTNLTPGSYILLAIPHTGFLPAFYRTDGRQTLRWKQADSLEVASDSKSTGIDFNLLAIPDTGFAIIKGVISDDKGNPAPGCLVFVTNEDQSIQAFSTSGSDGQYLIENLSPGTYTVSTEKVDFTGTSLSNVALDYQSNISVTVPLTVTVLGPASLEGARVMVNSYSLLQNYPNPFNPSTIIEFSIPREGLVMLKVFDLGGQEVSTLINEVMKPGVYKIQFQAGALASGLYFYRLNANDESITRKMTILK